MVSVNRSYDRIVVRVDGSDASRHALLWAVEEAKIKRGHLLVAQLDPAVAVLDPARSEAGPLPGHLLGPSATAASARQPGVAVGTLLLTGDVTEALVSLSRYATVLVVGMDPRSPHVDGAVGPIADRVVAEASCPVVLVSTRLGANGSFHRVVVGWTDDADAAQVLSSAADEAAARSAGLSVVAADPDDPPGRSAHTRSTEDSALARAIRAVELTYPQLKVTLDSSTVQLSDALERETALADLLVVGFGGSDELRSLRTPDLPHDMSRRSRCPVMLVGPLARLSLGSRAAA